MKARLSLGVTLILVVLASASPADYASVRKKIDLIESSSLKPGARVELTLAEVNAYAAHELPAGVRNAKVVVTGPGIATGTAMVDFVKVRRAQGENPGWLFSKLFDGERPVSVTAHIRSSRGTATVDVRRVEVSGLEIDGGTLEFLIQNVLLPLYPEAAVGRPFELGHRIERVDVQPKAVGIVIGR